MDIVEKVGLAPNMNKLWELMINNTIDIKEKEQLFSIYHDFYPPIPDKQSPTKQLMRFNEIQIQTIFYQELKHGKKLLIQKRTKGQSQNSPFVKTYIDLLETEYKRLKQNIFSDICPITFGSFFYFIEKVVSLLVKMFPFKFDLIYKWLRREGKSILKLSSFLNSQKQNTELQQFSIQQLFIKRSIRFQMNLHLALVQNNDLNVLDVDGKLWSLYFKIKLLTSDQPTKANMLKKIEQLKEKLHVQYLPISLQLIKMRLYLTINYNTEFNIVDLDNLFNQFYDSYDTKLLSEFEDICSLYINNYSVRRKSNEIIGIYDGLLDFPGEKKKWLLWKEYIDTMLKLNRIDVIPSLYQRAIPFLSLTEVNIAWKTFYDLMKPQVSFEQFKDEQTRLLVTSRKKSFISPQLISKQPSPPVQPLRQQCHPSFQQHSSQYPQQFSVPQNMYQVPMGYQSISQQPSYINQIQQPMPIPQKPIGYLPPSYPQQF
ncbi:hypothetical protein EHI8A_231820 [Entamoeba histolytica HM-1:IMSS-B]|uniref:Uncharacterized protein n=7 Tax=Entamoeba TaxID=5758 RepID=C4M969_ENTH1|nr:hypothetical protein EHI_135800 [Entamoeba histolytica HM-1:IMSS]EAL48616.2 hypothetical protein EHI_135800 [Entamoeba histolytica HM-1:IMSS]EMD44303.1 Hypothetical protein EHI5A_059760 [Entamoeba histolytica KU27]EMH77519.1 hypothetical protein EHI8A_231820 [Entamoeba histolytica HM-1:IMSS-B]ENY65411.1 hypothetical protein EHI7A_196390 [Entamoeba histolytica HM-1:IMSS-A]|eukprot:XP_654002.2 hypothetical protein EHI_135800 [Entamoeba histolytica HM-1:IMSS]